MHVYPTGCAVRCLGLRWTEPRDEPHARDIGETRTGTPRDERTRTRRRRGRNPVGQGHRYARVAAAAAVAIRYGPGSPLLTAGGQRASCRTIFRHPFAPPKSIYPAPTGLCRVQAKQGSRARTILMHRARNAAATQFCCARVPFVVVIRTQRGCGSSSGTGCVHADELRSI